MSKVYDPDIIERNGRKTGRKRTALRQRAVTKSRNSTDSLSSRIPLDRDCMSVIRAAIRQWISLPGSAGWKDIMSFSR